MTSPSWYTLKCSLLGFYLRLILSSDSELHRAGLVRGTWAHLLLGAHYFLELPWKQTGLGQGSKGVHPTSTDPNVCPVVRTLLNSPGLVVLLVIWGEGPRKEWISSWLVHSVPIPWKVVGEVILDTQSWLSPPMEAGTYKEQQAARYNWSLGYGWGESVREGWRGRVGTGASFCRGYTLKGSGIFGPCSRVSARVLLSSWRYPIHLAALFWTYWSLGWA